MDNIAYIKERVDIADAVEFYGMRVGRGKKILCPFHADKNPSMTLKGGKFRCWACGAHGDVIDLVQQLFLLDFIQAGDKLNDDFSLGLNFARTKTLSVEQVKRQERIKEAKKERAERMELKEMRLIEAHRKLFMSGKHEAWREKIANKLDQMEALR